MAIDRSKFRGVVVPMVSPFTPSGAIDEPAVHRIVDLLCGAGHAGVFPLGTTGESASIPADDKRRLVAAVAERVNGRSMVYVGISGTVFRETVEAASAYKAMGVDAVVAHMPSYYPLDDAEIEAYFLRLADASPLPLVLYNIPVTTHHHIALPVVERLTPHDNVAALKDSAGDPARLTELLRMTGGRKGFPVLLGASPHFTHGLKGGAVGLVPSGAHLAAVEYQQMFAAAMRDDWREVERMQDATNAVCAAYVKGRSVGQGLAILKALMEKRGLCGRTMLPPLQTHVGDVS